MARAITRIVWTHILYDDAKRIVVVVWKVEWVFSGKVMAKRE